MKLNNLINKNENFINLIKITETMIHKLKDTQNRTNTYIANILGLYSYGENMRHKPDFLVWNLLRISDNIKQMGNQYSIINKDKIDNQMTQLSSIHLYLLAQYFFGELIKQVYNVFELDEYVFNSHVCDKCKLRTNIKAHEDYVSWSVIYILYNMGCIDREIKNINKNGKKTYKWIKRISNKSLIIGDCVQRQLDYATKISYAEYEALMVLKDLQNTNDKLTMIIPQHKNKECKDKECLPFDVVIVMNGEKNIYIELDGEQHFEKTFYSRGDKLEYIQNHDKIKTNFVVNNNELLIRIPYSDNHRIKKILNVVVNDMVDKKGFYTTDIDKYDYLNVIAKQMVIR